MKLSLTALALVEGKVNSGWLMSWLRSCFVSIREQISTATRVLYSAQFVSEVTGLKMSAEIKNVGAEEEREKKDTVKADNK